MWPSYSPLFTLGLLAGHSTTTSPAVEPFPSPQSTSNDDASAIYFTLQKAGKRDTVQLRSFLYLDLADRKQHAPSHKRKLSTLTKSTSWTCTDVKSFYDFARTEKPIALVAPAVPMVPARRRASRESLRNIPLPKPAPSATLPDLPTTFDSRPLPSSTLSTERLASATASPSSSHPLAPRTRRQASLGSASISSQDRRKSRMNALACLEGRVPNRVSRSSNLRNNFMSFSDDEEDKLASHANSTTTTTEIQTEDLSAFADVEDEADVVVPTMPRRHESADPQAKPVRPTRTGRRRRSTLESWFPLKSFIDLKDDDLSSWNWRSFIEIGGVA